MPRRSTNNLVETIILVVMLCALGYELHRIADAIEAIAARLPTKSNTP